MTRPRKKRRRPEVTRVPRSDAALPEYDRSTVPEGLVTRRQLREMGLSPGDNEGPVAILRCKLCATRPQWSCRHPTRGYLLRVDLAKPKRVPTLAQEWALDRAMAARSTCPECGRRYWFCLPLRSQGCCDPCARGFEPSPDTYVASTAPVIHRLAA
ncbi:RRQRL motif-containing zinc-binding protein [Streptomyces sp. NPDC096046]|uniref:RRQRL motif-containing zinc-binding protein n=1 Tax=Streptomyces sp. NPDC096046 TaxID=3155542 RepID=UPI003320EF6A